MTQDERFLKSCQIDPLSYFAHDWQGKLAERLAEKNSDEIDDMAQLIAENERLRECVRQLEACFWPTPEMRWCDDRRLLIACACLACGMLTLGLLIGTNL